MHDLIGKTFHRLKVTQKLGKLKNNRIYWECLCECGNTAVVATSMLRTEKVKSCGCLRNERISKWAKDNAALDNTYGLHKLYSNYRRDAIKRGYCFELSLAQFETLLQKSCYYCGDLPNNSIKHPTASYIDDYKYNGIDRVDNTKGYILDNVVTCCKMCNMAKRTMSKDEFLTWIHKVYTQSFVKEYNNE